MTVAAAPALDRSCRRRAVDARISTGVLLAPAMTHHIEADLHQILAAHFIAVLGCSWFGNLGVTAVESFFHVSGVGLLGAVDR